jgi:ubiquinone/menaquinone biosynthesis C-methylase UbiE
MKKSSHKAMLAEVLDLKGKSVVDVGCGDGAMVRHLAGQGARAIGIEFSPSQLERACAAEKVADESYVAGSGDALPFDAASLDAVFYFNSLHHLPLGSMAPALGEARRVLRPGGLLVVVEPLAEGLYFALLQPLEDETAVRAAAYAALKSPPAGLTAERELFYLNTFSFHDVEQLLAHAVAVDASRSPRLPAVEAVMRQTFAETARREGQMFAYDQPMRLNTFRRGEA